MNNKKIITLMILALVMIMAIGYALFSTTLVINGTSNITGTWNVYFESITTGTIVGNASNETTPSVSSTTATINANLDLPGDSISYEIILKNGGTANAVIENIKAEAIGSSAIIYSINGIKIGERLASGETRTITIKIEYDVNTSVLPEETSKTLIVSINAVQDIGQTITESEPELVQTEYLSSVILKSNKSYADNIASEYVKSETGIDFNLTSSDTNGKGLYYTSTNTENDKKTYYFRGAVDNNYVSFAGQVWRIVRINEDGSIRLILDKGYTSSKFSEAGTTGVSYMVEEAETGEYNYSQIYRALENYYYGYSVSNASNTLSSKEAYLADAGFCNDRSKVNNSYGAYERLINNRTPQFACPQTKDLFTKNTNNQGNKLLWASIGLLTIDEVVYAGGRAGIEYSDYYLANGESWWTMSPYTEGSMFRVTPKGNLFYEYVENEYSTAEITNRVRPVINLKSSVTVASGSGIETDPYVINTN